MSAPATEGELYDRLKALAAECEALADPELVDAQTKACLDSAATHLRGALRVWVSQG